MSLTTSLAHPVARVSPFSGHCHESWWITTTSRPQTTPARPGLPCLGISGLELLCVSGLHVFLSLGLLSLGLPGACGREWPLELPGKLSPQTLAQGRGAGLDEVLSELFALFQLDWKKKIPTKLSLYKSAESLRLHWAEDLDGCFCLGVK